MPSLMQLPDVNPAPGPGVVESAESKALRARSTLWEANLKLADAMKNKDCAGLFDSKVMKGVTPNQIFLAMVGGGSIEGKRLSIEFDRSDKFDGPAEVFRNSQSINLSIKADYWLGNVSNGDWIENIGMLIHEVGHFADLLFGDGASQMATPDISGSNDKKSRDNDALVKKKCFP